MSIEQHAEAAAQKFWDMTDVTLAELVETIRQHMQAAVDEATAKQMARIGVLTSEIARLEAEVVRANTERVRTQDAYQKTDSEVVQTLGKALRYPWFKDDPANFPGATEADGVAVGDHVAETLAMEAARRIADLEKLGPLIAELTRHAIAFGWCRLDKDQDSAVELNKRQAEINATLEGAR